MKPPSASDPDIARVEAFLRLEDPDFTRVAETLRNTFDQLYDGQHTGRYRWDQLYKTEKTHFGTLIEINLRRVLAGVINDGYKLDYHIDGVDVDCKYSQRIGGWMLPPETLGHVCLVITADDQQCIWSAGLVRASEKHLGNGKNRDGKRSLNAEGRASIVWLAYNAPLPPNVLLQLNPKDVENMMQLNSGQARINQLFRLTEGYLVGRGVIATVAGQADYMKRVRNNGGARTALATEGFVILSGNYRNQADIAVKLGLVRPNRSQLISSKIVPDYSPTAVQIAGSGWRRASLGETVTTPAPIITGPN
ncbi:MAG: NaeI family type II restriction endonuclease [Mycobacteriaceae bacterium]